MTETGYQTTTRAGKRFVLVPEDVFNRAFARRPPPARRPPLPKPDALGRVPAVEYARASIARSIITERERLGLSQAELARRAGVRVETLNRLERGKTSPDLRTIDKINRVLVAAAKRTGRAGGAAAGAGGAKRSAAEAVKDAMRRSS